MRKGLRFDIFRRDNFTCRYCGAQPPDVVLEVDHVVPRVDGGSDDPLNLATSCGDCNRGKSRKRLDITSAAQPDADIEYLAVQQEIAEIERYEHSLAQRQHARNRIIITFQKLWMEVSGLDWYPTEDVFNGLLTKFDLETIEAAIRDVAPKVSTGYIASYDDRKWIAYMHAVCRNITAEGGD